MKRKKAQWKVSQGAKGYLKTLRRIPAKIRLSMMTREFDMADAQFCICGWALRENIATARAKALGLKADIYRELSSGVPSTCGRLWGSRDEDASEWHTLFSDVTNSYHLPLVEEAFVLAVAEAAEGRELVTL